jgi:hypothetical protein
MCEEVQVTLEIVHLPVESGHRAKQSSTCRFDTDLPSGVPLVVSAEVALASVRLSHYGI